MMYTIQIVQTRQRLYDDGSTEDCFVRVVQDGAHVSRGPGFNGKRDARMFADGVATGLRVALRGHVTVGIEEVWEHDIRTKSERRAAMIGAKDATDRLIVAGDQVQLSDRTGEVMWVGIRSAADQTRIAEVAWLDGTQTVTSCELLRVLS